MNTIHIVALFVADLTVIVGAMIPVVVWVKKIVEGQRCQLRKDMLQIYYHNLERRTIRQYEYENFVALYNAYKALKGNSFIDKIYAEVKTWKVVT